MQYYTVKLIVTLFKALAEFWKFAVVNYYFTIYLVCVCVCVCVCVYVAGGGGGGGRGEHGAAHHIGSLK